jgi:hypothetical protein
MTESDFGIGIGKRQTLPPIHHHKKSLHFNFYERYLFNKLKREIDFFATLEKNKTSSRDAVIKHNQP